MRPRLFKPSTRFQRQACGLSALSLLGLAVACSGPSFTAGANGGSSGDSGGAAGNAAGTGGDAGEPTTSGGDSGSSEGGASGSVGFAGSGGKGPSSCGDCVAGEYCQDGTTKCQSCADFNRVQFTKPQKLTTLSLTGSQRFPRAASAGSGLFYTVGADDATKIWYAPAPVSGAGAPVNGAGAVKVESGPLLAPGFTDGKELFFDRAELMTNKRKLWAAHWNGTNATGDTLAGTPYNSVGFDDYSIAVSADTKRSYWMSTRNGEAQLVWYSAAPADAMTTPAVLDVKVNANCSRVGDDATPWVNAKGTVLLFRSESVDADCKSNDSHANDLFAVPLGDDGTPATIAVPLAALNTIGGGSNQTDPSFSPDLCSIYFASDGGTGDYDLYRADRK